MKHALSVATRVLATTVIAPVMALALAAPSNAAEPTYGPTIADVVPDTVLDEFLTSPVVPGLTSPTLPTDVDFGEAAANAAESLLSGTAIAEKKPGKKNKPGKKGGKHSPTRPPKPQSGGVAERAIGVAAAQIGDPYRYGAAGPDAFDCSGLTSFSYGAAGRPLPRTSSAQRGALRTIPASARQRGDLVFFHGSSGVYHVGIYVGDNQIIHAPGSGSSVQRATIWTSSVSYGRP